MEFTDIGWLMLGVAVATMVADFLVSSYKVESAYRVFLVCAAAAIGARLGMSSLVDKPVSVSSSFMDVTGYAENVIALRASFFAGFAALLACEGLRALTLQRRSTVEVGVSSHLAQAVAAGLLTSSLCALAVLVTGYDWRPGL